MNSFQKTAWINLGTSLLAVISFIALCSMTGHPGASAMLALLWYGLAGFYCFLSGRKDESFRQWDEYHTEVARRARGTGGLAVAICESMIFCYVNLYYFGDSIPFETFQAFALLVIVVFMGVHSLATLIIYKSDREERRSLLDRWRGMSVIKQHGFVGMVSIWTYPAMYWLTARASSKINIRPEYLTSPLVFSFFLMYFLLLYQLRRFARTDGVKVGLTKAFWVSLGALLASAALVVPGMIWMAARRGDFWPSYLPLGGLIVILAADTVLFLVLLFPQAARNEMRNTISSDN